MRQQYRAVCLLGFGLLGNLIAQPPAPDVELLTMRQQISIVRHEKTETDQGLKNQSKQLDAIAARSAEYKKAQADLANARLDAQVLFDAHVRAGMSLAEANEERKAAEAYALEVFTAATQTMVPRSMPEYDAAIAANTAAMDQRRASLANAQQRCQSALDAFRAHRKDADPTWSCK